MRLIEDNDFIFYVEEDIDILPSVLWINIILPYLNYEEMEGIKEYNEFFKKECEKLQNNFSKQFFRNNLADKRLYDLYSTLSKEYDNKLICQSQAKAYLPIDILNTMEHTEKNNPYFRSSSLMKLYDLKNVLSRCMSHYGGYDEYIKYIENKKIKRDKLIKNKIYKQQYRKEELIEELRKYKLEYRKDSALYKIYIEGKKIDYTLKEIIQIMCLMKYWYEYIPHSIHNRMYMDRKNDLETLERNWENEDEHAIYHTEWNIPFHKIIERYIEIPNKWPWID